MAGIETVALARYQFAFTIMFHILWPVLIVGLSLFLVIVEAAWIKTGNLVYYRHARFWSRFFLLFTAVGIATGFPMEFQFGMNWNLFSEAGGDFFGHILGYEGAMAFMLEASFLGIMFFGWKRVSRRMHFFATCMVAFGASLSAFWILIANSWMQVPTGGHFANGKFIVTDYFKALFTPDMIWSVPHMWFACLEISLFLVGGLSAWYLLRRRYTDFFLRSFKIAVIAAIFITPLQIWLGDGSGEADFRLQPEKLAAMEAHWETNPPGKGAAWNLLAWPDPEREKNKWEISIPYVLSILSTRSLNGKVKGLRDFPKEDRPPIVVPFYAFRVMVAAGFLLFLIMVWTLWDWRKGNLTTGRIHSRRALLYSWIAGIPISYIAMETGWLVREVGRQPWIIYRMMRTSEAATPLPPAAVATSFSVYVFVYVFLLFCIFFFARHLIRKGPDLETPIEKEV
jgi:cytochrome d ubiquinol oxidase subunit I